MPFMAIFGAIKAFVVTFWKPLLIGSVILVGWLYIHGLQTNIRNLEEDNLILTTNNVTLKMNTMRLEDVIHDTNQSIELIQETTKGTEQEFAELQKLVNIQSTALRVRLKHLATEQLPETCDATMLYLIDARSDFK